MATLSKEISALTPVPFEAAPLGGDPQDPQVLASHITPPSFEFQAVVSRAEASLLQMPVWPKLVSICAAPGYGKTVLMSRLHAALLQRGTRCLWVTLDDRDTDVSSLLFMIRAALAKADAEQGASEAGPSSQFSAHSFYNQGGAVDRIVADLTQLDDATVLFVDNLGYCVDPQLRTLLERLVFASPPGLRLVLSSTREMPVDIVRAKLECGAVELRALQLSLDRGGIARLMRDAGVENPSEALLDRIQTQTEGWATGVRLLQVLLLQEFDAQADPTAVEGVVGQFSGDQRDIAYWLTRRVLTGFEPELVKFMAEVALVREFSAELTLHMTGRAEAGEWLRMLVARNVLIFPLDRSRRWLRFHTLLREFLLAEGRELLTPERRREVQERAAQWHASQGDRITALGIALDAQAVTLAEGLLTQVASVVAGDQGRMAPYIQWVDRLLALGGRVSLEAQGWYVWALSHTMQYERARSALAAVDAQLAEDGVGNTELRAQLPFLRAVVNVYLDRLPESRADALALVQVSGARDALFQGVALALAALADIQEGALVDARQRMDGCDLALSRTGSPWTRAWAAIIRAMLDLVEAQPGRADGVLSTARSEAVRALGEEAQVVATQDFVHARALFDLGRIEQARDAARRAFGPHLHHGIASSTELAVSVCAALWSGEEGDVFDASAIDRLTSGYSPRVRMAAAASRVRRFLRLGRVQEARLLAQRFQLLAPPVDAAYGDTLLAALEMQVAMGSADQAQALVEKHLATAQSQGRHRDRVELLLLLAELLARRQQDGRAAGQLALAVAAAAPGRLVEPFLGRAQFVAQVLRQHRTKDLGLVLPIELAFLERLSVLLPVVAEVTEVPAVNATEALSAREVELLALLDQGLANQQLADRLGLSLATVKWHLRNLYAKLGVGNRSAALAKARGLNLLPR